MKVLFVTLFSLETNTSVTKSNIGLLKGLHDCGYEITLLTPNAFADEQINCFIKENDICSIRLNNPLKVSGIVNSFHKSHGFKHKLMLFLRKVFYSFKVYDKTKSYVKYINGLRDLDKFYDVIISTSDPKTSHLFVKKLIEKKKVLFGKWIQHWGDPLLGDISSNRIIPKFVIKHTEKILLSKATKVIYVSPFTLEAQKKNYPFYSEKMFFEPLPCLQNSSLNSNLKIDYTKVCYLGDYNSRVRNIMPLYKAINNNKEFSLVIAGNTDLVLSETDNIKVYKRVSQEEAKKIENECFVSITIDNLYGTQIPGKIYYSADNNKHILIALEKNRIDDKINYLLSFNRFFVCENNENSIIDSIKQLASCRDKQYTVPDKLLPENIVKKIIN